MTSPTGSTSAIDNRDEALSAVEADLTSLGDWLRAQDWRGYDPFDALSSPVLAAVFGHTRPTRQLAIQALKRSRLNLRPILGVPKQSFAKALALGVSAYARMGRDCRAFDGSLAAALLERLLEKRLLGSGLWGYEFDVQTRWAHYPKGTPNAIATSFALNALMDVAEAGLQRGTETAAQSGLKTDPERGVDGEVGAAAHVLDAAQRLVEGQFVGGARAFFRYVPGSDVLIDNANALAAGAVARAAGSSGQSGLLEAAHDAALTTAAGQGEDGSWRYGAGANLGWVDSFHTAYTLAGLSAVDRAVPDERLKFAIRRGHDFYRRAFFDDGGVPRYYAHRDALGDTHTAATAIGYFAREAEDPSLALEIYQWARANIRSDAGFFRASVRNPIPYVRWSEGHMFLALAELRRALARRSRGATT